MEGSARDNVLEEVTPNLSNFILFFSAKPPHPESKISSPLFFLVSFSARESHSGFFFSFPHQKLSRFFFLNCSLFSPFFFISRLPLPKYLFFPPIKKTIAHLSLMHAAQNSPLPPCPKSPQMAIDPKTRVYKYALLR